MIMNQTKYQICTETIMDTSDPTIIFDENGRSDYYHNFKNTIAPNWHTDDKGLNQLMAISKTKTFTSAELKKTQKSNKH